MMEKESDIFHLQRLIARCEARMAQTEDPLDEESHTKMRYVKFLNLDKQNRSISLKIISAPQSGPGVVDSM